MAVPRIVRLSKGKQININKDMKMLIVVIVATLTCLN